jgi:ribosomal protein S18
VPHYKEIQHREEGKRVVVEAVQVPSPHAERLVTEGCREGRAHCHPFCRSPVVGQVRDRSGGETNPSVHQVKHTDVLILQQFLTKEGEVHSQEDLGICKRQWTRIRKMTEMAQRAGLMPGREFYAKEVRKTKWGSQNCYWDEKSIDIQWNNARRKDKMREFRSGFFRKY